MFMFNSSSLRYQTKNRSNKSKPDLMGSSSMLKTNFVNKPSYKEKDKNTLKQYTTKQEFKDC